MALSRLRHSARVTTGIALGCFAALGALGCRQNPSDVAADVRFGGKTMGTTYSIIVPAGGDPEAYQPPVDSLLLAINAEVSTYEASSLITKFNSGDTVVLPVLDAGAINVGLYDQPGEHFAANLWLAAEPVLTTEGYFDPTVGPLVEYYGFGSGPLDTTAIDLGEVERLRQLVGMSKVGMDTAASGDSFGLFSRSQGVRLDLSAIAKGYAVDQVCYLLAERFGATRYFVEIGGESRAAGLSPRDDAWSVGINTPDPGASTTDMALLITLSDLAVATSGNYRNVRTRGGKPIVHTVDPRSGLPKSSTLLSATVLAEQCAVADAYATACMASAEDAARVLAKAGLSGCLIFATASGDFEARYVGEFTRYVKQVPE